MINPIPLGQNIEFVVPEDTVNPTVWLIGPISSLAKIAIFSSFGSNLTQENKGELGKISPLLFNLELVRFGLKGFRNFKLNGKDVEFKTEKRTIYNKTILAVSDELLEIIPLTALNAIGTKILEEQEITKEERKNS